MIASQSAAAGTHTVAKQIANARCASTPCLATWPAPNACVDSVSSAAHMPWTIECPVMLHSTVASPMAASSPSRSIWPSLGCTAPYLAGPLPVAIQPFTPATSPVGKMVA